MIFTGDCIVSEAAARALKRASARAIDRGTNIVSQQDLFVALLQEATLETEAAISSVPLLRTLHAALSETPEKLREIDARRFSVDVWASKPLQKAIEIAAVDGRITAKGLLTGLIGAPTTHLLHLVAEEYRSNSGIFEE